MVRKGFGLRFLAALIDLVFTIILGGIIGLIFGAGFVISYGMPARGGAATVATSGAAMLFGIVAALIGLAYFATEIFMAASPGHLLLKMKITQQDGSPANQQMLIKRFCIRRAPQIIALIAAIPGLRVLGFANLVVSILIVVSCFMTLRATRLALHDEWSGTAVYGPGTEIVPQGFPVQPLSSSTVAPPVTQTTI